MQRVHKRSSANIKVVPSGRKMVRMEENFNLEVEDGNASRLSPYWNLHPANAITDSPSQKLGSAGKNATPKSVISSITPANDMRNPSPVINSFKGCFSSAHFLSIKNASSDEIIFDLLLRECGMHAGCPILARFLRKGGIPRKHPAEPSNQLNHHSLPHQRRRPLQTRQRDIAFRIKNAIDLGAARLPQHRHARLGNLFLLHRPSQLPRNDLLDGLRLRFLKDVFLLQEVVKARSQILLTHLLLFFLAANSGGSSSPSTGGFPFPTRFRMRAILAGSEVPLSPIPFGSASHLLNRLSSSFCARVPLTRASSRPPRILSST